MGNYSIECYNTLSRATNGFTAWNSNQHLIHLPAQTKNTGNDITSAQGAKVRGYLTHEWAAPREAHLKTVGETRVTLNVQSNRRY